MNEQEREYKRIIALVMGDNFVDLLFDCTTSDTTVVGFRAALELLAYRCAHYGKIEPEYASAILETYNPGSEYNIRLFNKIASGYKLNKPLLSIGTVVNFNRINGREGYTGTITGYTYVEGSDMYVVALDDAIVGLDITIRLIVVAAGNATEIER